MSFPFGIFERIAAPFRKRSGIEAGAGGRRWEGASTLFAPQGQIAAARAAAQHRAAGQSVNAPYGARIVETWCAALVGKGWQARSGHPDTETARALNDDFEALVRPVLPVVARALVRDGEAFVRIVIAADGAPRVKPVPAAQVDPTITRDLGGGARIVSGIEFDADDDIEAYHILPEAPDAPFAPYGAAMRIPARDVLHVFDPIFPGQVRGLSWLSPVLLKLRDRDEASDALLMQLKTASLMTGFIRDPDGTFGGFDGPSDGGAINVALEPGAMRVLPPNADVTFSNPGAGLQQAMEFLRLQDREIAAGAGLTAEALTGDLSETNYSSARVGLLEFRRRAEMLQRNLIEGMFLRPLWQRWIGLLALSGVIANRSGDLADFRKVTFIPPGWAWVDPAKEVAADVAAIEAGLKSREEVVAGRGRDIDALSEEIARDAGRDRGGTAA